MRPQHPQAPLTEEQRSLASSIELAKQQNAKDRDRAVLMIELRKWCVEKAVEGYKHEFKHLDSNDAVSIPSIAEKILTFVSAPLQE
jgi:hypothetical protein